MENLDGCQIPCLPRFAEGSVDDDSQPWLQRFKRTFAKPWNYHVKIWLKRADRYLSKWVARFNSNVAVAAKTKIKPATGALEAGDFVRVRSREEIKATLDKWKELRGCALLDNMWQYCGSVQQVR